MKRIRATYVYEARLSNGVAVYITGSNRQKWDVSSSIDRIPFSRGYSTRYDALVAAEKLMNAKGNEK